MKRLAAAERRATAALIRALIELDARRLYLGEGYSSLFVYCTQALHLAERAAYNRIETARAARRFPMVLEGLAPEQFKVHGGIAARSARGVRNVEAHSRCGHARSVAT